MKLQRIPKTPSFFGKKKKKYPGKKNVSILRIRKNEQR